MANCKAALHADFEPLLNALHRRLIEGDNSVTNELCQLVQPILACQVQSRIVAADPHEVWIATDDALLVYFNHPERFDGARGRLVGWLGTIALNRMRDLRRRARRRLVHEVASGIDMASLKGSEAEGVCSCDEGDRTLEAVLALARCNSEQAFLRARLEGAPLAAQAMALGIGHLPARDQRRGVYRAIEKIVRRARRRNRSPESV